MKQVLFALFTSFIISCGKESEQLPISFLDKSYQNVLVGIETKVQMKDGWGIVRGTGIVTMHCGRIKILTAAHIIKDTKDQEVEWIKVRFPDKANAVEAKLVAWEPSSYPDKILWTIRFENGKVKCLINPSFDEVLLAIMMGRSTVIQIDKGPMPGFDMAALELIE